MNTTLQKRIDEAKKKIIQEYVESFRYENGMELEPSIKIFLEKMGSVFFEHGMSFASQNQWISVDEALPEENKLGDSDFVFVKTSIKFPFLACYSYKHETWKDINHVAIHGVTHWMPLPEFPKGGEK